MKSATLFSPVTKTNSIQAEAKNLPQVILQATSLKKIPYSDKPLALGGKIEYLTPAEYEKKFNCQYTESLLGDKKLAEQFSQGAIEKVRSENSISEQEILHRLSNPLDGFIISKISDEVGYGLFATKSYEKNTILFLYSGVIAPISAELSQDVYLSIYAKNEKLQNATSVITASQYGGLARFMQHLPTSHAAVFKEKFKEKMGDVADYEKRESDFLKQSKDLLTGEFDKMIFHDESLRDKIATANVDSAQCIVGNIIVLAIRVGRRINAGDAIGFSYGPSYWQKRKIEPRLFMKDGTLVPKNAYKTEEKNSITAISAFKPKDPFKLYQQGIEAFRDKKYMAAMELLEEAGQLFEKKTGVKSVECGNCCAALASCYRELKAEDQAIKVCESGLKIYQDIGAVEKIKSLTKKYHQLLSMQNTQIIYNQAVELYNECSINSAILRLEFLTYAFVNPTDKAACYVALANCYKDVGSHTKALVNYNHALTIYQEIKPHPIEQIKVLTDNISILTKPAKDRERGRPNMLKNYHF